MNVTELPEPTGDIQFVIFGVFLFLGWISWLGMKMYLNKKPVKASKATKRDSEDYHLTRDIAENARQIALLSQAQEFAAQTAKDNQDRTDKHVDELFLKIDSLDARVGTKIDNLINAILKGK